MATPITAGTTQSIFSTLKEKIGTATTALMDAGSPLYARFERAVTEKVGTRGLRRPLKLLPAGIPRIVNLEGGSFGRGSGPHWEHTYTTPIPMAVAMEVNLKPQLETGSSELSVGPNLVADMLKDGTNRMKGFLERAILGDGSGVLGIVASGGNTTTPVFNGPLGVKRLMERMPYEVYDSTLTVHKGTVNLEKKFPVTRSASLTSALATGATGDRYLPAGMTGPSPTWVKGIYYHVSNAATGLWEGIPRSDWANIRSIAVDAQSSALALSHVRTLRTRVAIMWDDASDQTGGNTWLINPVFRHSYERLGTLVTTMQRSPTQRTGLELLTNTDEIMVDGLPVFSSPNVDPSRCDLISFQNFQKAELVPVKPLEVDGQTIFPLYSSDDGGILAAQIFYLYCAMNMMASNVGKMGYIHSMAILPDYPEYGT